LPKNTFFFNFLAFWQFLQRKKPFLVQKSTNFQKKGGGGVDVSPFSCTFLVKIYTPPPPFWKIGRYLDQKRRLSLRKLPKSLKFEKKGRFWAKKWVNFGLNFRKFEK
jgi:hypothetical protein